MRRGVGTHYTHRYAHYVTVASYFGQEATSADYPPKVVVKTSRLPAKYPVSTRSIIYPPRL